MKEKWSNRTVTQIWVLDGESSNTPVLNLCNLLTVTESVFETKNAIYKNTLLIILSNKIHSYKIN